MSSKQQEISMERLVGAYGGTADSFRGGKPLPSTLRKMLGIFGRCRSLFNHLANEGLEINLIHIKTLQGSDDKLVPSSNVQLPVQDQKGFSFHRA